MKNIMKKDEGFIQYALCIMLISICTLIMLFSLRTKIVQEQKAFIEDGITASALASAVIDINEYGTYGYLRSGSNNKWDDEEQALFDTFVDNLKLNLKLDDAMYPNRSNGIITSDIKIVNFWIYNKELKPVEGKYIRDYNGNWVQQHREENDYIIFKYVANKDPKTGLAKKGYTITEEKAISSSKGTILTPEDNNMINFDKNNPGEGIDGAGKGQRLVDGMTIYCTIQFSINPFGYSEGDTYNSGLFGVGSLVGDTVVTKSVVVSVNQDKE